MTKNVVGSNSITRVDSFNKVTGNAYFSADIKLPGMLYGKILMSPHPHARILKINTSRAEKLPGVKAVIPNADTPRERYGIFSSTRDQYPLALDKVLLWSLYSNDQRPTCFGLPYFGSGM